MTSSKRIGCVVALFMVALLIRSPHLFSDPRFWAEEGPHYYFALQEGSFLSVLTLVVRGNFQFLTNLFVYFSTLVPAIWSPYVTTYLALAIAAIPAALIGIFSIENKWSLAKTLLIVVILALLPHGYEIYLSTTNLQWIGAISLLLISVLSVSEWRTPAIVSVYVWTAVCGLTGIPSVILAPMFLLRRFVAPSRRHFNVGLILGVCTLIQASVLLMHAHPGRQISLDGLVLTLPLFLQTVLTPLFGVDAVESVTTPILGDTSTALVMVVIVLGVLLVSYAVRSSFQDAQERIVPITLFALWLGVSTFQTLGALGNPIGLVSGWGGARYFFLGAVCFLLMLGIAARGKNFAMVLLATMLVAGVYQVINNGAWKQFIMDGPSWSQQVRDCRGVRPCTVMVWPSGPDSTFDLMRK